MAYPVEGLQIVEEVVRYLLCEFLVQVPFLLDFDYRLNVGKRFQLHDKLDL